MYIENIRSLSFYTWVY